MTTGDRDERQTRRYFLDLPPGSPMLPATTWAAIFTWLIPLRYMMEYALMARLVRNGQLSEEALPVFGYTWFKVIPGTLSLSKGLYGSVIPMPI